MSPTRPNASQVLPPDVAAMSPDKTMEPDGEARKALAHTLVQPGALPGQASRAPTDDIPTISLGHGASGQPPAELEVMSPLGSGGTGNVYLAHQRSLHRDVAVKVLRSEASDLGLSLVSEARVATRVDHPNVVPVYLLGKSAEGAPLLVMKHIRGASWLELVDDPHNAMWQQLAARRERVITHLDIFLSVLNAVGAAHRQGIIHRDIKPSNVMIAGPGEVYLMDWGIAFDRAVPPPASATSLVGTPAYMAPEMLTGDARDLDERTDIFMLGATLHHVLTGSHRNAGATTEVALKALRELAPYDYAGVVPEELGVICNRATALEPRDRYASIAELREAVQTFIDHHESFRMAEHARAQIDAVARLARTDGDAPRLLEEARYVLRGALEAWSENPTATAEMARLRALHIEVELARDNLAAARGLLAELGAAASPALAAQVATREAEEQLRREREAKLAALEREVDLRTAARTRRWFFGLLGAYAGFAAVLFLVVRARAGEDVTGMRGIIFSVVSTSLFLVMLVVARREILGNRLNRAIVGTVGATFFFNLVHRLLAYDAGGGPRLTLAVDTLAMGAFAAIATLLISPRLWSVPAVCGVGVLVSALAPVAAQPAFAVCALFMIWRMVREWGRDPTV